MISLEDLKRLEENSTVGLVLSLNLNSDKDEIIDKLNTKYSSWVKYEASKNGISEIEFSSIIKSSMEEKSIFRIIEIRNWLCRSSLFIEKYGISLSLIWDIDFI